MDQKKAQQFRQKLIDLRTELRALGEALDDASQTVELDQSRVGRLSRMDALQGQQMALEAGRRRQLQLKGISTALQRIESGEFGYCLACGEAIDVRRLHIDPTSTLCIICAEKE
jgi:DnaK suppressor protein